MIAKLYKTSMYVPLDNKSTAAVLYIMIHGPRGG